MRLWPQCSKTYAPPCKLAIELKPNTVLESPAKKIYQKYTLNFKMKFLPLEDLVFLTYYLLTIVSFGFK